MMFDLGRYYLEQGQSIVFDTPCYYDEIIETGMKLSKIYDAKYKYLDCKVEDFQVIKTRISLRDNMTSQLKEVSSKGFENAKNCKVKPRRGYMKIDTSNFDNIDYDLILKHLDS